MSEQPAKNSKWLKIVSSPFSDERRLVRVMGVIENYVVARHTGAMPFLTPAKKWHAQFKPATSQEGDE